MVQNATAPAAAPIPDSISHVRVGLRNRTTELVAVTICSLIAGAIYTLVLGEDVNWDWQNYHEYNVWAVLNGRYQTDVLPPGFQTYFNPIVYFPVYYLRHSLPSPFGLAIMGAVHGLNLVLIYLLSRVLLREAATFWSIAASVLIAAIGPMTLSEVGTSFADILIALPVVGGITLIVAGDRSPRTMYLLTGLLLGAAVGLKLTNVVYALGVAAAVLLATRPVTAIVCVGLGGLVGAALTGGAWSLVAWRDMGNPIFPLFNAVFQSKEVASTNLMDAQFLPRDIWDALAYPFYWLAGDYRSSEHSFRDARFAVASVLAVLGIAARIARRRAIFRPLDTRFMVLFAVSYLAWLGLFSIQRYAVVLELLCGPLIVLLLTRIIADQAQPASLATRAPPPNAMVISLALAIALWSQPADWWRRPWSAPYQPQIPNTLEQPAIYFLLDKPIAYVAPMLPPQSRFYQLADIGVPILPGGRLDQRIRAGLGDPLPGGIRELHLRGRPVRTDLLRRYGFAIDASKPCVEIEGAQLGTMLVTCLLIAQ